ncbi:hypothetical protein GCM10022217_28100 [Chryseobacterium ginsenosidimutans]
MKKKVFKYGFVYWVIILLNIFLFTSFLIGLYNRLETNNFDYFLDAISFITISLISVLSLISLILLIVKNKHSIIVFSAVLFLILLIISVFVFYSVFILGDFGENISDLYTVPMVYIIIFGFLFIIYRFKYRENTYELEIEDIGIHND